MATKQRKRVFASDVKPGVRVNDDEHFATDLFTANGLILSA